MCPETESRLSDESSSKLLQVILQYPKNFLGWIHKSSYNLWNCPFSSLWLTSRCTQNHFLLFALVLSRKALTATNPTKSIPHTLTDSEQNVRTLHFFHRPWAQPRETRPLRQKKPLVCASPKCRNFCIYQAFTQRGFRTPSQRNFKNTCFVRNEIGWWIVHWNFKNKTRNLESLQWT